MKTEERHELKKNELTEILKQIEPYWRAIAGVGVVLVTVVLATTFLSSSQKRAREAGWSEFFAAAANRDPEALQTLAEAQKGNAVAPWAQYSAAQGKLIEGSVAMATDRAAAKRILQEAVEGFQKAVDQAGNYELIKERALWGMAQAHENLDELSSAKDLYKQIVETWSGSAIADRAKARLDALNDPATQDFYKWYFAQTPPAQLPPSGEVPNLPFGQLPDEPDLSVPDPLGSGNTDPGTIDLQLPYSDTEETVEEEGDNEVGADNNADGDSSATDGDSSATDGDGTP